MTTPLCKRCGNLLPSNVKFCPECGAPTSSSGISTSAPTDLSPSHQDPEQKVSTKYGPPSHGVPLRNPYGSSPYDAPPPSPTPTPEPTPPTARRRLSPGLTVLLVIVALLIIAACGGLIYYTAVLIPNRAHMQATATAQVQSTATTHAQQVTATTQAQQANATATALVVQANATATAQAQATATALSITITSPKDRSHVPISTTVQGTAQNIPKDEQLWLFIQPSNVNSYFPQGNSANPLPITIFDGKWSILAQIGGANDSGLTFTLIPVLINQNDQEAHNAIIKYFQQTGVPAYYGIQQTGGMHLLTTDQVQVVRT